MYKVLLFRHHLCEGSIGTRENKFQSSKKLCKHRSIFKISSSVLVHQYFQVFHTKFNTSFRRLVLLEMIVCYSNFWWIFVSGPQTGENEKMRMGPSRGKTVEYYNER